MANARSEVERTSPLRRQQAMRERRIRGRCGASVLDIVFCVVGIGSLAVVLGLFYSNVVANPLPGVQVEKIRGWREYASGAVVVGKEASPVVITEFSDFQCPQCKEMARQLERFTASHPEIVQVRFRNYPLTKHPAALPAAAAGLCAVRQGAFREMHDEMFARQDSLGLIPWSRIATAAGIRDTAAFVRCMGEPVTRAEIAADQQAARALDITATPSYLVNGYLMRGRVSDAWLERLVAKASR